MGFSIKRVEVEDGVEISSGYVVSLPVMMEVQISGGPVEDPVDAQYQAELLLEQMGDVSLLLEGATHKGMATIFPLRPTVQFPGS